MGYCDNTHEMIPFAVFGKKGSGVKGKKKKNKRKERSVFFCHQWNKTKRACWSCKNNNDNFRFQCNVDQSGFSLKHT